MSGTAPAIYGHRGGSVGPPNSVEAIRLAAAAGADGVEIDLQIDGRGRVVARHDLGDEPDEAGGADDPAGLEEVLATIEELGLSLLIDFKSGGRPEREATRLAESLRAVARPASVLISSFSVPFLERFETVTSRFSLYPIVSLRQNFWPPIDVERWAGASVLAAALVANPVLARRLRHNGRDLYVWFALTEWRPAIRVAARSGARGVIVSNVERTVELFGTGRKAGGDANRPGSV